MKIPLVVAFTILLVCNYRGSAFANTISLLKLNPAENYILKQVEEGAIADLQKRFPREEDRTIGAKFLKKLITGSYSDLRVTKNGIRIRRAIIKEPLDLDNVEVSLLVLLEYC